MDGVACVDTRVSFRPYEDQVTFKNVIFKVRKWPRVASCALHNALNVTKKQNRKLLKRTWAGHVLVTLGTLEQRWFTVSQHLKIIHQYK